MAKNSPKKSLFIFYTFFHISFSLSIKKISIKEFLFFLLTFPLSDIALYPKPNLLLNSSNPFRSLVDKRTNLSRETRQELEENYGSIVKIFDTQIPMAIKTAESTSQGKSIFSYDKNSKVAEAYSSFAREIENGRTKEKNATTKDYER